MTPTERTLKALAEQGAISGMVERFNQFGGPIVFKTINGRRVGKRTGVRQDLFGIIDIISLFPGRSKVCGVQSCGTAFSEHKKKILQNAYAPKWLEYADLELWAWRPLKREGKTIIAPKIYKFSLADWFLQ